ncbi:MAG: acyl-CoA thioester hydrolase [Candidatus Eremiobacteraeota bacterium]|nr:acyl-CoA thioester hydrolase [Candidatus Eremiobacteraeota bacterium]
MLELYEPGSEADWLRSFRFALDLRPRFCETDALGHVSNTVYTEYWEAARLRYFESIGEADDAPKRVLAFNHMAVEITTRMMRPCFYDEPLLVHARIASLGRSSATFEHALTSPQSGEIRAIARIAVVCSADDEHATPWTPGQRAKLEAFEGRAL